MAKTLTLIYHAAKVRLGFLIMACALAGIAVSPGNGLAPWRVLVLGLAVLVASSAAGAFNQLYERDLDARMKRTRGRAFVTGRLRANWYWVAALVLITMLALLAAAMATNVSAAFYIFLGAFTYGVIYTVWLKTRTWLNIVIGGLAGSFAVLAGSAAVGATFAPAPVLMAVVLFLWTPPHFWALAYACKDDYAAAGVPMLPVVASEPVAVWSIFGHTLALVVLSLALGWYGMGWIYMLAALAGGLYFLVESLRLALQPATSRAWRTFAASIVQLGLLLTGAIIDNLALS
ncbi:MAG: protoheme IX farnesyltransferase [Chromatiales bacterium]|nr:MAG: protoheme IX farnesyltransferase [Chromatiales bacterium]